jgi:hypothetical protein
MQYEQKILKGWHLSIVSCLISMGIAQGAMLAPTIPPVPLSIPEAIKRFAKDPDALKRAKDAIREYYTKIIDDKNNDTGYTRELRLICQNAYKKFEKIANEITSNKDAKVPAVVVDIDETVLSSFGLQERNDFMVQAGGDKTYNYRLAKECEAIPPVRDLCIALKQFGFSIIFISSRRDTKELRQATLENLMEQKIPVDMLRLMPLDLFNQKYPVGLWKEGVRKEFSLMHQICGCIGDSPSDMAGEYCGHKVKLPNLLY